MHSKVVEMVTAQLGHLTVPEYKNRGRMDLSTEVRLTPLSRWQRWDKIIES